MKKILFIFITSLLIGCNENFDENSDANTSSNFKKVEDLNFTQKDRLRLKFGKALVQALKDNESLRKFIKEEALKQFNKDYDVLYQLVKDKELSNRDYTHRATNSTYNTFRSILLGYFSSESELIEIENSLPLLTLFVPKLPEGSFSAETWDTSVTEQNPAVAIRMDECNDVPILFNTQDELVLEGEYIPDFPIILLKDNERLLSNSMVGYDDLSTTILSGGSGISFKFIDENLDPSTVVGDPNFENPSQPVTVQRVTNDNNFLYNEPIDWFFIPGRDTTVAPFLINAYNVFNGTVTNPWQRDYIYYGLTPTNTTGVMNNFYKEAITYFSLQGSPINVYNHLSQRSPGNPDPALAGSVASRSPGPLWTDGNFEFIVTFIHGSKSDPNGTVTKRIFTASPSDVFNATHSKEKISWLSSNIMNIWRWRPTITGLKPIDFYGGFNGQMLILARWDLHDLSNKFTIKFEEGDIPVYNEDVRMQQSKHNTNINFDATTGDKTKLGIKYGASSEITESLSRKWSWTTAGFNFIGEQQIDFFDNVVNKHPVTNKYYPALHSAGMLAFEMRPIQTNF